MNTISPVKPRQSSASSPRGLRAWASHNMWLLGFAVLSAVLAVASYPLRTQLFADIAGDTESSGFGSVAMFIADQCLWVLLALVAVMVAVGIRSRAPWLGTLVAGGVGVIMSLGISTAIKVVVQEARPCASGLVHTAAVCPAAGDYSWPSNHALLAAAFAAACVLARPKTAWLAVPVAALIAIGRVAEGVHYVHDVATGVALGLIVVSIVVWLLRPILDATINQYWSVPRHAAMANPSR